MERTTQDVDAFIAGLDDDVRDDMRRLDAEISKVMKGHPRDLYTGKFWGGSDQEIIGYGLQTYQRSDKTEVTWFIVGLARQKNYLSVYINVAEEGKYLSEKYGAELGNVKVGKASLGFKTVADIDVAKLADLVKRARSLSESGA